MDYKTWSYLVFCMLGYSTMSVDGAVCIGMVNCAKILGVGFEELSGGFLLQQLDIDTTCSVLDAFKSCVTNITKGTCISIIDEISTINLQLDFMCGEGKQVLLQHRNCWPNSSLDTAAVQCYSLIKFDHLDFNRYCTDSQGFTKCMSNATETMCGKGPACIIEKMMNIALTPVFKFLRRCTPYDSCSTTTVQPTSQSPMTTEWPWTSDWTSTQHATHMLTNLWSWTNKTSKIWSRATTSKTSKVWSRVTKPSAVLTRTPRPSMPLTTISPTGKLRSSKSGPTDGADCITFCPIVYIAVTSFCMYTTYA